MASKHFNLSDREIKEFNGRALDTVVDYCSDNYCSVSEGTADVVIGGYQKWLIKNNFQIIDLNEFDLVPKKD